MADPVPVLLNAGGGALREGGEAIVEAIRMAFGQRGVTPSLRLMEGGELAQAARDARDQGAPLVVVGGGDGSMGCVAGVLAGSASAHGLLPLGTLNHLARDLAIPTDLDEALAVVLTGRRERIDIGEVNGRRFVNNCSIGLYPGWLHRRDAGRRLGYPKWLAGLPAAWRALWQLRHHRLRVTLDGQAIVIRTPLLFIGNNAYSTAPGSLGRRQSLKDGKLSVYALADQSPASLVALGLRLLVGWVHPQRDCALVGEGTEILVEAHQDDIEIGIDGEYARMTTPLTFRIHPGALSVMVPCA